MRGPSFDEPGWDPGRQLRVRRRHSPPASAGIVVTLMQEAIDKCQNSQ